MYYIEMIKKLNDSIKNDAEISQEEKNEAKALLNKLANLLAMY